ncbi:MAG: PDZ domain-containing protein [Terracidiphilus sp.]
MSAMHRARFVFLFTLVLACVAGICPHVAEAATKPHIYQHPALSKDLIAFGYAGDLWTVPREGGRATRLTVGVGIESAPVFSPDGSTIAFTGEYDGNTDVFTIPATGGVPYRVTYHPAADFAVGWTPDGKQIVFRSNRQSASRYTQLYEVPAKGGVATVLPLPMAYQGEIANDGGHIAYSPLPPAFGFDYTSFVSWGNYHGGRAGTIWITSLPGLDSVEIPHEISSDFSPVYVGEDVYFLSGRKGATGIFKYDPASKSVTEALHNGGPDIRSLSGDGTTLVYDQLGEIYLFDTATSKARQVPIEIDADLPEVRPRIESVADQIDHTSLSPTGLRVAVEAHGEILTVAAKHGPTRDITNTPGVMERAPAWSPDGQSIAYFSDESGLYALHVASQFGNSQTGTAAVKKFALASEPAYYFDPVWSPDSKKIVFHDNRLHIYMVDTTTGKLTTISDNNVFGGFSSQTYETSWSPDSKWIAYPRSMANHLHAIYLYSLESGQSTQVTSEMADSKSPAFDREGKYLYFIASTNAGATSDGLDMTSDLYQVTSNIYAAVLAADQASPIAPELEDEKPAAEAKADAKKGEGPGGDESAKEGGDEKAAKPAPVKPTRIDLAGIGSRIVALPLPAAAYIGLATGAKGSLYFLEIPDSGRFAGRAATLSRWVLEDRKAEKFAEGVLSFELSADGKKMLLSQSHRDPAIGDGPGTGPPPGWVIVPANAPVKPGEGAVSFADLKVHVTPSAEWEQMYHEVWRIERAFFYDAHFHGTDTVADEKRFEPYVASIASRADLNYIFQEMLGAFSVGHLRGNGGQIPEAKHVPGGLLGADYVIKDNHYCLAKIYTGGLFNPQIKAPLAQPGLNLSVGDCILAINGEELTAAVDIQEPLEGTAGHVVSLQVASGDGKNARDISVVPVASEATLRNIDWIEGNQHKVDELSGGKVAYVYLPDTGGPGFTNFNRYYFAQTQKQGAIIDERFNGGGQVADYFVEVLGRHIESYWAPRYGQIEHTPNAAVYGPKVMLANEFSGSGGDALPWLFKQAKLGPLVGKRTWGGLVGIGAIPVLMDGGHVTSPSVAFFSPKGVWDVENHGVDPDYVVEQDPKAVSEGHDPQLEKAVALALEELAKHPPAEPVKPAYPNYHQK